MTLKDTFLVSMAAYTVRNMLCFKFDHIYKACLMLNP